MKRTINHKLYNTSTAERVGYYHNGLEDNDFNVVEEVLYRKKNGEFFLHGWGGANTNYRKKIGQRWWSDGEAIVPLSLGEAREWAELHLDADKCIELFGEVEKG